MKKTTIRKKNQVEATCRWIVESYASLLQKNGTKKIPIAHICKRAGIGRTTFYRYYNSCEDIILDQFQKLNTELIESLSEVETPLSGALAHFHIMKLWKKNPHASSLALAPEFPGLFNQYFYETRKLLEDSYGLAKINNRYALAFREGGFTWLYLEWFKNGMKESPEKMTQILASILTGEDVEH